MRGPACDYKLSGEILFLSLLSTQCQGQNRQPCFLFCRVRCTFHSFLTLWPYSPWTLTLKGVSHQILPSSGIQCLSPVPGISAATETGQRASPPLHFGDPSFPNFHANSAMCQERSLKKYFIQHVNYNQGSC